MKLAPFLLLGLLMFSGCAPAAPRRRTRTPPLSVRVSDSEQSTVDAVNRLRAEAGLGALEISADLTQVARAHSAYQARSGRSGHQGEGGSSAADRAAATGVAYQALAENVAMNYGYSDPVATAVNEWMNSPPHRRNILNRAFKQTGVGIAVSPEGKSYFTQMFLDPASP